MPLPSPITAESVRTGDADRMLKLLRGAKAIGSYIGLSQRDVLNLIKAGDFPAFQVGNKMVADREAIERWLAAKSVAKMLGTL